MQVSQLFGSTRDKRESERANKKKRERERETERWLSRQFDLNTNSPHDKTGFYLKRGSDILVRHALESGLFPLSQHPINTNRVRVVPLVLNP